MTPRRTLQPLFAIVLALCAGIVGCSRGMSPINTVPQSAGRFLHKMSVTPTPFTPFTVCVYTATPNPPASQGGQATCYVQPTNTTANVTYNTTVNGKTVGTMGDFAAIPDQRPAPANTCGPTTWSFVPSGVTAHGVSATITPTSIVAGANSCSRVEHVQVSVHTTTALDASMNTGYYVHGSFSECNNSIPPQCIPMGMNAGSIQLQNPLRLHDDKSGTGDANDLQNKHPVRVGGQLRQIWVGGGNSVNWDSAKGCSWTIPYPDYTVGGYGNGSASPPPPYTVSDASGSYIPPSPAPQATTGVYVYWTNPSPQNDGQLTVTCNVIPPGFAAEQPVRSAVYYTVKVPTLATPAPLWGTIAVDTNYHIPGISNNINTCDKVVDINLHYGDPCPTPPAGGSVPAITHTLTATADADEAGSVAVFQLTDIHDTWQNADQTYGSSTSRDANGNETFCSDNGIFYGSTAGKNSSPLNANSAVTATFLDAPAHDLYSQLQASVYEQFQDYYMYKPSGQNSIWVPLGYLGWAWDANTTYNATSATWLNPPNILVQSTPTHLTLWGNVSTQTLPAWPHLPTWPCLYKNGQ